MRGRRDDRFHSSCEVVAPLPTTGAQSSPPEWITIFPKIGRFQTRDGRSFSVDPQAIMARFAADAVDLPIDINHATAHAASTGARADAVGWITELRLQGGALQGKVDWLDEGREALRGKKVRYASPDFFHDKDGNIAWVRAVALVTAPALAQQQALASARADAPRSASDAQPVYGVVASRLPEGNPPEWIIAFPALGFVETYQEVVYYIDGKEICDAFAKASRSKGDSFREYPVYLTHNLDIAFEKGDDVPADPVGYVTEMRVDAGRVMARVAWTAEAGSAALRNLASSPTFFVEAGGKVKRLKSISLVKHAVSFRKARSLGNEATAYDRSYTPPTPEDVEQFMARGMRPASDSRRDKLQARATRLAFNGEANDAEMALLMMEAFDVDREEKGLGPSDDRYEVYWSSQRDPLATARYLFPHHQMRVTILGEAQMHSVGPATHNSQLGASSDASYSPSEPLTASQLQVAAKKMVDEGRATDFMSALSMLSDLQSGRLSAGRQANTPANSPASDGSQHTAADARRLEKKARELMAEAEKEGVSLTFFDAIAQAAKALKIETPATTERDEEAPAETVQDVLEEAHGIMASAAAAGRPMDLTSAIEAIASRRERAAAKQKR